MSLLENPFPGLRPFEADQAHLFFGRDAQCDDLVARLARHRFVAVVGSSGSGKSSLVRAGLLPSLQGGLLTAAGSTWRIAVLRPGNDPIQQLAAALDHTLAQAVGKPEEAAMAAEFTLATLRRGPLGLIEAARLGGISAAENLLVVVDQFEELFRFAPVAGSETRDDRAAFVRLLLEAAQQSPVPIYVVLTLRSDYIGECSRYLGLAAAVSESQFLVPRLSREQLKEAILGPAAVGGAGVSPRLVQRLLGDVDEDSDQLPVLQHALMRTWQCWEKAGASGPIDLVHYEETGGTASALSRHADEAYAELDGEGERIARLLFRCLTEKNEERGIRRPTTLAEVAAVSAATPSAVAAVVEVFRREGRSFLMPPVGVQLEEKTVLDLSHESLMRVWTRLRAWVDEEGAAATRYRRLAESAALHAAGETGLLRDPELATAEQWWRHERPTAAWAERYPLKGADFATTFSFLERSQVVGLWRRRVRSAILPVLFSLLISAGAWRAKTELNAKIAEGKAASQKARQEIADLLVLQKQLQAQISLLSVSETHKDDDLTLLKAEVANLERQVAEQKTTNRDLEQRFDKLKARTRELQIKRDASVTEKAIFEKRAEDLRRRAPTLAALVEKRKATEACLRQKVASSQNEVGRLRSDAERLGLNTSFESGSMRMSSTGDPRDLGGTPPEEPNLRAASLRREVEALEARLRELEAAGATTQLEIDRARQAKALLTTLLSELQYQAKELEQQIAVEEEKAQKLKGEIQELQKVIAQVQEAVRKLVAQTAAAERELKALETSIAELNTRLANLQEDRRLLTREIEEARSSRYAARALDPGLPADRAAVMALRAFVESNPEPWDEDPKLTLLLTSSLQRLDPAAAARVTNEIIGETASQSDEVSALQRLADTLCRSRPKIDSAAAWNAAAPEGFEFDAAKGDPCRQIVDRSEEEPEEIRCE